MFTFKTVSYTHLDVYKRQSLMWWFLLASHILRHWPMEGIRLSGQFFTPRPRGCPHLHLTMTSRGGTVYTSCHLVSSTVLATCKCSPSPTTAVREVFPFIKEWHHKALLIFFSTLGDLCLLKQKIVFYKNAHVTNVTFIIQNHTSAHTNTHSSEYYLFKSNILSLL